MRPPISNSQAQEALPINPERGRRFVSANGSASGGPEVWNVGAWGDVRECRAIATIIEEVREALELGCRTISIERQGAPTASPNADLRQDADNARGT